MLKTILVFLGGIFFGFWFSWLTPSVLINYWKGGEDDKNLTVDTSHGKGEEGFRKGFWGEECFHEGKALAAAVNVLCMVQTHPDTHYRTAQIKTTWGRRCNVLLFFSTTDNDSIPTIALPVPEGKASEWVRTKESFKFVYKKYIKYNKDEIDWVLAVDDETYVVLENLRYLLSRFDTLEPVYFSRTVKPNGTLPGVEPDRNGRVVGKAGYVLSKEAVRRFAVEVLDGNNACGADEKGKDVSELGKCMEILEVNAGIARYSLCKGRFPPTKQLDAVRLRLENNTYNDLTNDGGGWDCCSGLPITFHGSSFMHALEYILYHLYPFGVIQHV